MSRCTITPRASSPAWRPSTRSAVSARWSSPRRQPPITPASCLAMGSLETAVQLGWKKLDPTLRWLAVQATGMQIGCSWCVDYGYYEGMHDGIDPAKVRAVG